MHMSIDELLAKPKAGMDMDVVMASVFAVDQNELHRRLKALKYGPFLDTAYWAAVSTKVKERDGYTCRNPRCKAIGKTMHAHHTHYRFLGYDHKNMDHIVCLCCGCHKELHDKEKQAQDRLNKEFLSGEVIKTKRELKAERRRASKLRRREQRRLEAMANPERARTPQVRPLRKLTDEEMAWVDRHMPEGDPIVLTYDLIFQCWTFYNGQTNETLRNFGLTKPLISGWVDRLVGTSITAAKYRAALEGKFRKKTGPLPLREDVLLT